MGQDATHFTFLIEPGFTMQAFSSAVEVLRVAQKLGAEHALSYSVSALQPGPVAAANGIRVLPDARLDEALHDAAIVMVSGAEADRTPNPELIARLRVLARAGHEIWGVSSGVVRLAQAGLLEGATVAAHWEDIAYLRDFFPNVRAAPALFVPGGKHPTCSGGGAAADLMLDYVRCTNGEHFAKQTASALMIDGVRDGHLQQIKPADLRFATSSKQVFAAVKLMSARSCDPVPVQEIADRVGISQRQLERLFKAEFNLSPAKAYAEIRLAGARQEVIAGRRPLIDIALDYGYSVGTFSKVYRRVFGTLPSEDRQGSA